MPYPTRVPTIRLYAGDDADFDVYDFLDSVTGLPVDLSAHTWAAQWRTTPDSATAIDLIVDDSDADIGRIRVSVTGELTETMTASGVWDLQSTLAGVTKTWITSAVSCTKDVTRG